MTSSSPERDPELQTSGRALLRGSAGTFAVHVAGLGLGFGTQVLLARLLGAAAFGDFAWVGALFTLGVLVGQGGAPAASVRFVAAYRAEASLGRLRGLFVFGNRAVGVASGGVALLGLGTAFAYGEAGGPRVAALAVASLVVPVAAFQALQVARLRGLGRAVASQVPFHVVRPLALAVFLGLGALLAAPLSAADAYVAVGAALLLAFFVGFALVRSARPAGLRDAPVEGSPRVWLRVAAPLAGVGVLQLLWQQGDLLVLGVLRPSEDVGPYAAAGRVASLLSVGLVAVGIWTSPRFAALAARRERAALQRLLRQACRLSLLATLPPALPLLFLAAPVLRIFGPAFDEAVLPLAILLGGQLVNAATGPVGFVLSMTGEHDAALAVEAASALLAFGAALWLVPAYGAVGAASAGAGALTARNVAMVWVAWRRLGVRSLPL